MCKGTRKNEIRDAITNGENEWTPSAAQYRNRAYTAVFTTNYPQSTTVAKATITLALDANGDIRCYPHLTFRQVRNDYWQADFFKATGKLPGIRLEQVASNGPAKSGIAVNAILLDYSWRNWTQAKEAIATLKKCCRKLREWTDKYVANLS